ncbi:MAG: SDR family oxidoreductase [Acidobacteriia bacterium]|nr:SDR family oxidoreductase [Terriglobia bacterium]
MNVFLTGATGFLGGELAALLSKLTKIKRLYCLIRGDETGDPPHRLRQVFDFHGDAFDNTRIIPVEGELQDDKLAEKLMHVKEFREIDTVIHAAADTSFAPASAASNDKVNIGGTLQILNWVQTLPSLTTFLYIGTASICGTQLTNCHIHEDQSPNTAALHLVRHCYTKMQGEIEVTRAIPKEKLLVVRPSIIMGDSRDVKPRSCVILWALAAVNGIRLIPVNPESVLDIIPVDYAANAIAELLFSKRRWTTYHISAGKQSATNLAKVSGAIEGLFNDRPPFKYVRRQLLPHMKRWSKKHQPTSELLGFPEYVSYWSSAFNGNLRIVLAGLEPYFRFMELNQTLDNSRLLADTKLPAPPSPHEYLRKTGKYLNDIDLVAGALDP